MGNVKPDKDEEPTPKTLEVKDTLQPGEQPVYDKLGAVAQKIGSETLATEREQTLVGHFDPSSTQVQPEFDKLGEGIKSIGDEAAEADDNKPASEPTEQVEEPTQPQVVAEDVPSAPVASVAPVTRPASNGRFMDVVHPSSDMRSTLPRPTPPPTVPPRQVAPQVDSLPAQDTFSPAVEEHGSLTPFLPDANEKVEKRPLGAVPSPFGDEPKVDETQPEKSEDSGAVDEAKVADTSSINNDTVDEKPAQPQDDQQPVDATKVAEELTPEEKELQAVESLEVAEPPRDDESIEKVESGDTEKIRNQLDQGASSSKSDSKPEGAIYDTEQFQQPLNHPKKHKSGWGKVLIIILIIVICASAAGAAYLLLA